MNTITRRGLLIGGLGAAGTVGLGAYAATQGSSPSTPRGPFGAPTPVSPDRGQAVVTKTLTAKPITLDLAGRTVSTWGYGDAVPGPLLRANAGDFLRVTLDNQLPDETTIHWHGIRLRNQADGVPGMTQDPVKPDASYVGA